jgi:signal peptidase I
VRLRPSTSLSMPSRPTLPEQTSNDRGGPLAGPPRSRASGAGKRGWKRRVVDYLVVAVLAFMLVLLAVILYGATNNRWYKVIGVQGASMSPTINRGDLILMTRPEDPQIGDIGVFQVDGKIVTHRIVDITPDGEYITQGDANATPDDWSEAQVRLVGVYRARIPWVGRFWARPNAP